jgi:hypothetical protein
MSLRTVRVQSAAVLIYEDNSFILRILWCELARVVLSALSLLWEQCVASSFSNQRYVVKLILHQRYMCWLYCNYQALGCVL